MASKISVLNSSICQNDIVKLDVRCKGPQHCQKHSSNYLCVMVVQFPKIKFHVFSPHPNIATLASDWSTATGVLMGSEGCCKNMWNLISGN